MKIKKRKKNDRAAFFRGRGKYARRRMAVLVDSGSIEDRAALGAMVAIERMSHPMVVPLSIPPLDIEQVIKADFDYQIRTIMGDGSPAPQGPVEGILPAPQHGAHRYVGYQSRAGKVAAVRL